MQCKSIKFIIIMSLSIFDRRGSEKSGDIDILLTYKEGDLPNIIDSSAPNQNNKRKHESSEDEGVSSPKKAKDSAASSSSSDTSEGAVLSPATKAKHRLALSRIVEQLFKDKIVTDTLSVGETKFMVRNPILLSKYVINLSFLLINVISFIVY